MRKNLQNLRLAVAIAAAATTTSAIAAPAPHDNTSATLQKDGNTTVNFKLRDGDEWKTYQTAVRALDEHGNVVNLSYYAVDYRYDGMKLTSEQVYNLTYDSNGNLVNQDYENRVYTLTFAQDHMTEYAYGDNTKTVSESSVKEYGASTVTSKAESHKMKGHVYASGQGATPESLDMVLRGEEPSVGCDYQVVDILGDYGN